MSDTFNWRAVLDRLTPEQREWLEKYTNIDMVCESTCSSCPFENGDVCDALSDYYIAELCRRAVEEYKVENTVNAFVSKCMDKQDKAIDTLISAQLEEYVANGVHPSDLVLVQKNGSNGFAWYLAYERNLRKDWTV